VNFRRYVIVAELVMTAWSCKTWKVLSNFCVFFRKTNSYGKIFKILFRKFTSPHRSTLCWNVVKNFPKGSLRNRALFTGPKKNKISAASQTVAYTRPKSARASRQPPTFGSQCSRFHPYRFTFGGVIVERVKAVIFCLIEYFHYRLFEHQLMQFNYYLSFTTSGNIRRM